MQAATQTMIAIMPKDRTGLPAEDQDRFAILEHCYMKPTIAVSMINFSERVMIVAFDKYDEEDRLEIANRLAESMPIYKGLSSTQVYNAGMNLKLKVGINMLTIWTEEPIPDAITNKAIV